MQCVCFIHPQEREVFFQNAPLPVIEFHLGQGVK